MEILFHMLLKISNNHLKNVKMKNEKIHMNSKKSINSFKMQNRIGFLGRSHLRYFSYYYCTFVTLKITSFSRIFFSVETKLVFLTFNNFYSTIK